MTRDERGWFVAEPIRHGSTGGWRQHTRRGEYPPGRTCGCREAWNAYRREHGYDRVLSEPLQLDRARELRDLGLMTGSARQIADRTGLTARTIQRYRARLRSVA